MRTLIVEKSQNQVRVISDTRKIRPFVAKKVTKSKKKKG